MGSSVLYVPVPRKDASQTIKDVIASWRLAEEKNNRNISVIYSGEDLENRALNAKIYVVMHASLSAHDKDDAHIPHVTDGFNAVPIDIVAQRAIKDGLFQDSNTPLCIKLYYSDKAGSAKSLASLFLKVLAENPAAQNRPIRVDYYPNHMISSPSCTNEIKHKYIEKNNVIDLTTRVSHIRQSLYNRFSSVLYVPVPRKDVPYDMKSSITSWAYAEGKNNRSIAEIYSGEGLKNLASHAKIYVVMHGTNLSVNKAFSAVDDATLINFPSMADYLSITDGYNDVPINIVAQRLIKEGIFNNSNTHLRIKLFFCDEVGKAKRLASLFFKIICEDPAAQNRNIRVDFYPQYILYFPSNTNENKHYHKYVQKNQERDLSTRVSHIRQSLYNKSDCAPMLKSQTVKYAIEQYNFFNESGFLGRFGLGKWHVDKTSAETIEQLEKETDDEKRFKIADWYSKRHSQLLFTTYIKPLVEQAKEASKQAWKVNTP